MRINNEKVEKTVIQTGCIDDEPTEISRAQLAPEDDTTNTSETGFTCNKCGKSYKTSTTLGTHRLLKHPEDAPTVQCSKCDKKYASQLSLDKHDRYMHRSSRCRVCYMGFSTVELLAQHSESCSKVPSPCSLCIKVYDSPLALRNHCKYKHPEEKEHWCSVCRRTFRSSRGLANHVAAIHPRDATCSWCSRLFNSRTALHSHLLYKHSQDGARCRHCHKIFATKASLARHMERQHQGVHE